MANMLERDIQENEIVVVKKEVLKAEYRKREKRLFVCKSGFGMEYKTVGKTIYGYWLSDSPGETDIGLATISGYEISVEETEHYQQKYQKSVLG